MLGGYHALPTRCPSIRPFSETIEYTRESSAASVPIDLNLLLQAYAHGIFPMADSRDDDESFWIEPQQRAILPLEGLHLSSSLAKVIRQDRFRVTTDCAFADVILKCAEATPDRKETWINSDIEKAFLELADRGMAHSVECWCDGELVGGLYGLSMGRAFFGESMFSRATDASKVALVWLVARLRAGGFTLLDCQFMTDHLRSLGAIEITQQHYLELLDVALGRAKASQISCVASPSPESADSSAAAAAAAGAALGDWGVLDDLLGASSPDSASSAGASSPGKLILHSLTQTS
ncbi:leucyl/phenylalanyl-tRNA--protein transferase [Sphingorhabdus pulchriflava]|uniref:Leucyl/phenylalanyl-tRNA--protein transferase n=2 Tax=Sphingorhabdus pulchriflava TaxID=2292257 RepID=A0A371BJR7_9SPHN|nr:leucyl/phenylalanyl-tRNA--protein transferase [Sphingorhabdus pulchriflava]